MDNFIFEGIKMEKHQKEYIKLLEDKFNIAGEPRIATYNRHRHTIESGIAVEIKNFGDGVVVFIADNPRSYLHKFATELVSEHLPPCVWLTRWSDKDLELHLGKGFFI